MIYMITNIATIGLSFLNLILQTSPTGALPQAQRAASPSHFLLEADENSYYSLENMASEGEINEARKEKRPG
ncbi:MAG: hypothetical protein ACE5G9_07050 [Nitrospinales bacterium]